MEQTEILGEIATIALRMEDEIIGTIRRSTDTGVEIGWQIQRDSNVFQVYTEPASEPTAACFIALSGMFDPYPEKNTLTDAQVEDLMQTVSKSHGPWDSDVARLTTTTDRGEQVFDGFVVSRRLCASDPSFGTESYRSTTERVINEATPIGQTLYDEVNSIIGPTQTEETQSSTTTSPAFN